jgi:ATP-binding cassette, subfamily B, bacterial
MNSHAGRGLLGAYLRPERRRAVLLGAVLFAGLALQLANPLIAKSFIDEASVGAPFGHLLHLAVAFVVVALAAQVSMVAETYVGNDLGWRTTNNLRADLVRKTLGLDASFYTRHNAGELVERLDGDVSAIAGFFSRFVVYVLGNGIFLLGVLVVVFTFDWRLGGVLALFALTALGVMTRAGGFVGRRSRAARTAVGRLSGFIEERLGGLVDLKSLGADGHVIAGLEEAMAERHRSSRASSLAGSAFTAGISGIFVLGTGASLAMAAWLYNRSVLSLGAVFAVLRYTAMIRFPLDQLARQMNSLQQATGGLVRVRELMDTPTVVLDGPGVSWPSGPAALEFDQVSFAYGSVGILERVSFRVAPGEVLGLVGRTGAGKTTMARLIFRLYDPGAGTILLDGHDIRKARLDQLRARVGLVTQEVQLFGASLRDNLSLFDPSVSEDHLMEVMAILGLEPWLSRLPDGLDTPLGPNGVGLSAGESQLVALGRVFLSDPGLVILDEASSRLDPATEAILETAITRLLEHRSGILIAHRLATMERADSILVLDQSQVAEWGSRTDLAVDPGSRFSQLLRVGLGEVLT